jgi:signal transduction histidine kinase
MDGSIFMVSNENTHPGDHLTERLQKQTGDVYGATATDIAYRKQAEEALRTAADIIQAIPSGLFIYQFQPPDQLILINANPTAEQLTGVSLREWQGKEFNEIWPQAKASGITAACLKVLQTGETLEVDDLYYEDEHLTNFFRLRVFAMPANRLGIAFEDITEMKAAETAAHEQRLLATTLVKTAQVINQTLDYETVMALVLENLKELVPHDGANLMLLDPSGENLEIYQVCNCYQENGLPPPGLHTLWPISQYPILQKTLNSTEPILVNDIHAHTGWKEHSHSWQIHAYLGISIQIEGKVIGVLNLDSMTVGFFTQTHVERFKMYVHQATGAIHNARLHKSLQDQYRQLRETQARLLQSEKLAAIGELVAGVAHELNNPLSGVILYAQLFQQRHGDENKDIQQIVTQAHRAASIVRSLLDFSRQRPPEQSPTHMNNLLRSTIEFMAYELRTHNVQVSLQLAQDLPVVMADPHQMQQVFVNLITNALQAMQLNGGQRLWVETAVTLPRSPVHRKKTLPGPPIVQISFRDEGPGIPPELQTRVFDPFFTTKPVGQGTGLGLSVCHGIISEHGGEIWLESHSGYGTTFYLTLPINQGKVTEATPANPEQRASDQTTSTKILLLDDEESILDVLARILQPYQVDMANQGAKALEKLAQRDYDIILCDVHMPGMSGIEFYKNLEQQYPHLKNRVVFMTGDTVNSQTMAYMEEIQAVTLAKPFDIVSLLTVVEEMLQPPS